MTVRSRHLLLALLAMWVGVVTYLTLTPTAHTPPLTLRGFVCIACGELDGSDIIRNWILFIPGGVLAALTLPLLPAVVLPICFTVVIEVIQIGVPGRDPATQDLIFNSLGALTGVVVARRGLAPWGRRLLGATAALAWLAPLVLLMPQTTPFDLYGLWTPRFGNVARYQGLLLEVSAGELSIESHIVRDKVMFDAAIIERSPVRLLLQVGPQPSSFAPVFGVRDDLQQLVLEIGALGPDLILRGRNPARLLKLDQPDTRWPGAMLGVAVGDTVPVVIDRGRESVCMSVGASERCNLAPSLADGWGHVLNLEGPPAWFRALMSLGWAAGVGGLLGLTSVSRRSALALASAIALLGYIGSHVSPDVRPSALHAAVLVGGALLGAMMRLPVTRLWTALRPP